MAKGGKQSGKIPSHQRNYHVCIELFYFLSSFSALTLLQDLQIPSRIILWMYLSLLRGTHQVPLALSPLQNKRMEITC